MSPQYICFDKYWSSGVSRVNEWNTELSSDYILLYILEILLVFFTSSPHALSMNSKDLRIF